jgi:methyltransferase of ATP-grasp peptide maturase system
VTTDVRERAAQLAASLARELADEGVLHSPAWDEAVRAVPRHVFVPSYVQQRPDGSWRTVSGDDPDTHDEWLITVYSNRALTTALRTDANGHGVAVSSSSKPGLMVRMLEALELRQEHRALEIGTGTGYNAALLCSRLGAQQVASVDVEPDLVATAQRRLARLGFTPTLAATDGAHGLPEAAPFDRIIATCSVARIPRSWADQLTARGRVLTDLKITGSAGNLVDLRMTSAGLAGRFLPKWAGFMPLRSVTSPRTRADRRPAAVERETSVPSPNPWWDHSVVWFLAALELPEDIVTGVVLDPDRRTPVAATMQAADGSWVEVRLDADDAGRRLVRASSDDLWSAVEHAYEVWNELGQPGWDHFGLIVTDREQRVWFDAPDDTYSWALPEG